MKKFGIICAGEAELEPFLRHIEGEKVTERATLKFHEGSINGVPVAAVICGVGKVNAAIAAQVLIDIYGVTAVINGGTGGGMDERVKIMDVVISERAGYHDIADIELGGFNPALTSWTFEADAALVSAARGLFGAEERVHFGLMATGDQFIEDDGRAEINARLAPLSVDMETAAIAHVCHLNKTPYIAIRGITDNAEHMGLDNFEENCARASEKSADMVIELISKVSE